MEYWIWLSQVPYIGPITANRLLNYFTEPVNIYSAEKADLMNVRGLTIRQIQSILSNKSLETSREIIDSCQKNNISIIRKNDMFYPNQAKVFEDAPIVLYYKGHFQEMEKSIAIVGARRCTQEIKKYAVKITEQYTREGYAIISGMAKGIDSYAHTACLSSGGYTVAVVGNGLDICYPCEHRKLMDRISDKGLLLSEYPPGTKPTRYTFPQRNRIISAWANKVVIIAPGKGSGALITAEYGKKYGKEVDIIQSR